MRFTKNINTSKMTSSIVGLLLVPFLGGIAILDPEKWILVTIIPLLIFILEPFIALVTFVFLIPFETSLVGVNEFVSFMKILGVILAIVYFINKAFKKDLPSFQDIPNAKLLLIFLALMFISSIFSSDTASSVIDYLTYLQLFVFYVIIVDVLDDEKKPRYLFIALLLSGFMNGIYSIYSCFFTRGTVFASTIHREGGFLENANRFGYMQTLIFLIALPYVLNIQSRLERFIAILSICIIIFSSFLSLSRGVLIALIVTVIYASMYLFRQKRIFLGLIIIVIVNMIILPDVFWDRAKTIMYVDASEGSRPTRLAFLRGGFLMGIANPLTGVGLGGFKAQFANYSNRVVSPTAGGAHNMYISIMGENGIPVLIVFLLLLYKCFRKTLTYRSTVVGKLASCVMGCELAMVFTLVEGFFATIEYSKILWLLLALCMVPEKINESFKNKSPILVKSTVNRN